MGVFTGFTGNVPPQTLPVLSASRLLAWLMLRDAACLAKEYFLVVTLQWTALDVAAAAKLAHSGLGVLTERAQEIDACGAGR